MLSGPRDPRSPRSLSAFPTVSAPGHTGGAGQVEAIDVCHGEGIPSTRRAMVEDEMVMSPAALASRFDKVEKTQPRLMSASRGHPGAKCWSCLGLRVSVCTLDSSVSTRNERRGHDCHRVEIHRCCVCWSRQVSLGGQVD